MFDELYEDLYRGKTFSKPVERDPQYYYVRYFGQAAALVLNGFELLYFDKSDPKAIMCVFKNTPLIIGTNAKYFSGELHVSAREFWDMISEIKRAAFSA